MELLIYVLRIMGIICFVYAILGLVRSGSSARVPKTRGRAVIALVVSLYIIAKYFRPMEAITAWQAREAASCNARSDARPGMRKPPRVESGEGPGFPGLSRFSAGIAFGLSNFRDKINSNLLINR